MKRKQTKPDKKSRKDLPMDKIGVAMQNLNMSMGELKHHEPIPFEDFLWLLVDRPHVMVRNVFQVFHDLIKSHIIQLEDEYPDDPESIHYVPYDCSPLFVDDADRPFFADRLFANRLLNLAEDLQLGAQQNKIYIFHGPPGCGKSTFLNNLLMKFEKYANTEEGLRYETVWRLDRELLGCTKDPEDNQLLDGLYRLLRSGQTEDGKTRESSAPPSKRPKGLLAEALVTQAEESFVEVKCPSHDNPILMIPKQYRREFFDNIFENDEFKWNLSTAKEFDWVFRDNACTICSSLYQALLQKLKCPQDVFKMIYAQPYQFNRRLGEGISVFNPGDRPLRHSIVSNNILQNRIDCLLRDSNQVQYLFSRYAKTNNGIYALMDIKSHNKERVIELHNIISEGIHKVENIEENVNSLFLAVMNPEDEKNLKGFQSFSDRIQYIKIPYVLDLQTEMSIYRNIFGRHIDESFLPRVLANFARVIIATRLDTESKALKEWIDDPDRYSLYCDKNLQLLKMEIYVGNIPPWLTEEDRKELTAKRRRDIISESEGEGESGFSGRDSIKIFSDFLSTYGKNGSLINMSNLVKYFTSQEDKFNDHIPEGLLDSLVRMYDYTILEEVKESLYYYNEQRISRDIQNYLFAINFELGSVEVCSYTGERLDIDEDFLHGIEDRLLDPEADDERRATFRGDTQKEYASKTLTQEIMSDGKDITETELYEDLHERYVYNLKEKVLDPFLKNENFRRAIKDYGEEDFKTYDKRIRADVTFLINNLGERFNYTAQSAKEVCIYVIDNDLAAKYAKN